MADVLDISSTGPALESSFGSLSGGQWISPIFFTQGRHGSFGKRSSRTSLVQDWVLIRERDWAGKVVEIRSAISV